MIPFSTLERILMDKWNESLKPQKFVFKHLSEKLDVFTFTKKSFYTCYFLHEK